MQTNANKRKHTDTNRQTQTAKQKHTKTDEHLGLGGVAEYLQPHKVTSSGHIDGVLPEVDPFLHSGRET